MSERTGADEPLAKRLKQRAQKMPRKRLGKTDMEVSCIGFGAASLGGVYGDADLEECRATVHEALHSYGINFFDTSPYYGNSEEVLGKCLEGLDRSSFYVATKLGRYGDGPEHYDISPEKVRSSVQTSLERLGCRYIDLIQIHDIEFGNLDDMVRLTLPALQELKQEGKICWVGITLYVLEKLVYVLEQCQEGHVDTVQTYARLSLLDNTLLDLGPYLKRKGLGVISGSPLGMGLLPGRPPVDWNSAPKVVVHACFRLKEVCEKEGASLPKKKRWRCSTPTLSTCRTQPLWGPRPGGGLRRTWRLIYIVHSDRSRG